MNDRPRIRRKDPARDAPVRDWSNMFRGPGAPAASSTEAPPAPLPPGRTAPSGVPDASAAPPLPSAFNDEARIGIETAYEVIDQHLREGRLAAQAQAPRDTPGTGPFGVAAPSAMSISSDSIQQVVTQGLRFYSSLMPLWAAFIKSLAAATVVPDASAAAAAGIAPAPLAPAPFPRAAADGRGPVIVEIASTRMARVTIDLPPAANAPNLALGALHPLDPGQPPLLDIALAFDPVANRHVVRIRVPDAQPAGVYSGVIVDRDAGAPRGTITLRIDG